MKFKTTLVALSSAAALALCVGSFPSPGFAQGGGAGTGAGGGGGMGAAGSSTGTGMSGSTGMGNAGARVPVERVRAPVVTVRWGLKALAEAPKAVQTRINRRAPWLCHDREHQSILAVRAPMATQPEDRVQVTRRIITLSRINWNSSDSRSPNCSELSLGSRVAFIEWTKDGHIRHPAFQGLRADKQARSVRRRPRWN